MPFLRSALLLAALAALAGPAVAQDADTAAAVFPGQHWFGNVELRLETDSATGADRSWVAVQDWADSVTLYWACEDLDLYIQLVPSEPEADPAITWRFDADEPRSVVVEHFPADTSGDSMTDLPREVHDEFTARARTARRLEVRMMVKGSPRFITFDIRGASRALSRLPCLLSKHPPGAGEYALGDARPWLDDPDYGETDEAPRLLNLEEVTAAMQEVYPEPLFQKGGTVMLVVRVEPDGSPDLQSLRVRSSTHAALTRAALQVAPVMRFAPARRDGRPVRGWVQVPLEFLTDP